jgi:hypothetical protein
MTFVFSSNALQNLLRKIENLWPIDLCALRLLVSRATCNWLIGNQPIKQYRLIARQPSRVDNLVNEYTGRET